MSTTPRSLVKNASNRDQVRNAERKEQDRRRQELHDLKTMLDHPSGRRVIWRLLSECQIFGSTYDHSGSKSAYNAGRQDVGHFWLTEIAEADANAFAQMMNEDRARQDRERRETDALHTPRTTAAERESEDEEVRD